MIYEFHLSYIFLEFRSFFSAILDEFELLFVCRRLSAKGRAIATARHWRLQGKYFRW